MRSCSLNQRFPLGRLVEMIRDNPIQAEVHTASLNEHNVSIWSNSETAARLWSLDPIAELEASRGVWRPVAGPHLANDNGTRIILDYGNRVTSSRENETAALKLRTREVLTTQEPVAADEDESGDEVSPDADVEATSLEEQYTADDDVQMPDAEELASSDQADAPMQSEDDNTSAASTHAGSTGTAALQAPPAPNRTPARALDDVTWHQENVPPGHIPGPVHNGHATKTIPVSTSANVGRPRLPPGHIHGPMHNGHATKSIQVSQGPPSRNPRKKPRCGPCQGRGWIPRGPRCRGHKPCDGLQPCNNCIENPTKNPCKYTGFPDLS